MMRRIIPWMVLMLVTGCSKDVSNSSVTVTATPQETFETLETSDPQNTSEAVEEDIYIDDISFDRFESELTELLKKDEENSFGRTNCYHDDMLGDVEIETDGEDHIVSIYIDSYSGDDLLLYVCKLLNIVNVEVPENETWNQKELGTVSVDQWVSEIESKSEGVCEVGDMSIFRMGSTYSIEAQ